MFWFSATFGGLWLRFKGLPICILQDGSESTADLKDCSNNSRAVTYAEGVTVVVMKKGHVASFTELNCQQGQLFNFSVAGSRGYFGYLERQDKTWAQGRPC